ncbi:NAD(P)H-dependent oxidoreductase [Amycolatopsis sp. A133]|uniref:NADPH-dependent FMN reductase n=1 Tax=Amycolatopsis sp. A133 TaxID=3064472 RepID=UPI0027F6C750|nr:NAD(P)H-dependent oxidoreductase [Amycolatopsis sp. A133]MDQ7809462.1 NAD(P)H-dependent oxidoreductase [Amycolatopsis sp. A133]
MKIAVVLGSTRPGRLGDRVCRFVMNQAALVDGAEFALLDLADHPMPFFDEPVAPLANHDRRPSAAVRAWLAAMAAADAYVFVTPEYNHAPPAVLKNALDFLATEADGKPASIVSYSTTAHGGILAGQQLRPALSKAGMLPLPKSLPLAHADRLLGPTGELVERSDRARRVAGFVPASLRDLVAHTRALNALSEARP